MRRRAPAVRQPPAGLSSLRCPANPQRQRRSAKVRSASPRQWFQTGGRSADQVAKGATGVSPAHRDRDLETGPADRSVPGAAAPAQWRFPASAPPSTSRCAAPRRRSAQRSCRTDADPQPAPCRRHLRRRSAGWHRTSGKTAPVWRLGPPVRPAPAPRPSPQVRAGGQAGPAGSGRHRPPVRGFPTTRG